MVFFISKVVKYLALLLFKVKALENSYTVLIYFETSFIFALFYADVFLTSEGRYNFFRARVRAGKTISVTSLWHLHDTFIPFSTSSSFSE